MPSYARCEEFIQGVAKLSNQLADGTSVKIEVRSKKLMPKYPYERAFLWGGDMMGKDKVIMPKTIISMVDIKVGNESVLVPLSAYSDLGNPYQILFEKTKRGFRLIIEGEGGTDTSYKAVLEFSDDNIQRRKVVLGVFPQEVWEETVYSFISRNNNVKGKTEISPL